MAEPADDRCGKCGVDIDPSRRIDFTLKDETRVCDSCFVRGKISPTRSGSIRGRPELGRVVGRSIDSGKQNLADIDLSPNCHDMFQTS